MQADALLPVNAAWNVTTVTPKNAAPKSSEPKRDGPKNAASSRYNGLPSFDDNEARRDFLQQRIEEMNTPEAHKQRHNAIVGSLERGKRRALTAAEVENAQAEVAAEVAGGAELAHGTDPTEAELEGEQAAEDEGGDRGADETWCRCTSATITMKWRINC